jgi:hypothetical protein
MSGQLSPDVTQRIVAKLAALIGGAEMRHLLGAGHMLPVMHGSIRKSCGVFGAPRNWRS